MRGNIRTIQDFAQTNISATDIRPIGSNPVLNAFQRAAIRNRELENPRLPSVEGSEDFRWISSINQNSETSDFRVGILANITEGRCDPGTYGFILRHMNEASINRLSRILDNASSYEEYEPILSTIFAGMGVEDEFGQAVQKLAREIRSTNPPISESFSDQISNIRTEMNQTIQTNIQQSNQEIETIRAAGNTERNRLFSPNWNTIARRGLVFIGTSVGAYFGAPYAVPLIRTLGEQLQPGLETLRGMGLIPPRRNPDWGIVRDSFNNSWSLFFDYWRRR